MKPIIKNPLILTTLILVALLLGCGAQKQLTAAQANLTDTKAKLDASQEQLTTAQADLTDTKGKLDASQGQLTTAQAALTDTKGKLGASQGQLATAQAALTDTKGKLDALQEQIQTSKVELATLKGEIKGMLDAKERARKEASSKATVSSQAGITMKSGDTKPIANTKIYLTKKYPDRNMSSKSVISPDSFRFIIQSRIQKSGVVATATTNFQGTAIFRDVVPGNYYLQCYTPLGGGDNFLVKKVKIKSGENSVSLSNDDIIRMNITFD